MATSFGRIGLALLIAFGIFAIFSPEFMPRVNAPYDKILHFGVFGIATLFAVLSVDNSKVALSLASVIVLIGILVEIIQSYIPGRSADMEDAVANALGAVTVLIFYFYLRRGGNGKAENLLQKDVMHVYQREKEAGTPNVKCLSAAADAYRQARPDVPEHDIRLDIIKWLENEHLK